ncbi:MAG TPA: DNA polymerase III subunit gamma/tau [Phycisphaerae bacterium]|nr:DNA polymerase III subunit gamma/tau [Phycisphaerae bacterium]
MAGYLVLARKYRSATFDEVVGQEPIARTLVNAIATKRIAQAYLFTGTRGVGKTTMARILAKALNCLGADEPTPTPCNKCDACVSTARGDDLDVIEIDGASNRGIDEIRELRANVSLHPARCRYKIYYIDEVHQITRDAFNALLKTLEEPPAHVKFIFATTQPEKIPATILSRCQRFDFRNIPTRLIAAHLAKVCEAEKAEADEDALFRLARAAAGSMRDGLSLLDQMLAAGEKVTDEQVVRILGVTPDERVTSIVRAVADGDAATALQELAGVMDGGVALLPLVAALGDFFRNMMLAATCGAESELIELPDVQRQVVAELAGRFSTPAVVQAVGIIQRLAYGVRTSSLARALVEAALVRLAEAEKFVDPQSLIERLEALSSGEPRRPAAGRPAPQAARPQAARPPATSYKKPAAAPPAPAAATPAPTAAPPAPAGDAGTTQTPTNSNNHLRELSTEEKNEVRNDPAVKEAVSLFGGEVVDMKRQPPPPPEKQEQA